MKKALIIILVSALLLAIIIPIGAFTLVYLGIYLKRDAGYLTDDIYLIIIDYWVTVEPLNCDMPDLPLMRNHSDIAVLNNGDLIVGYNSAAYQRNDYKPGYFVIDLQNNKSYIGMINSEYEVLLQSLVVSSPIEYKPAYEYIDIPRYKVAETAPKQRC